MFLLFLLLLLLLLLFFFFFFFFVFFFSFDHKGDLNRTLNFTQSNFCFSAPNAPPQNFAAFSISSTSIRVTWDPVPVENRQGIILGYRLFWDTDNKQSPARVKRRSSSGEELETEANVLSKDLVGLEKFTNYCVRAEAFNSKGNSNRTNRTCTRTDEDGMYAILNLDTFLGYHDIFQSAC